jgi:uncharacterized Zn-binding protein involved in type VI secretion
MSLTVYAEDMGLFHKGSNGQGIAPADVCLTPPPPPAGPIPVPYVNVLSASDLAKGSKTVKIDGEPTALEDQSEISTSSGDEAGTQGGNVVTHQTKGKGYFTLWSFTVKVEGKGVCRHGDPIGQNCASTPPGCVDAAAIVKFLAIPWVKKNRNKPCPPNKPYPGNNGTTEEQQNFCRGGPCWNCPATTSGWPARPSRDSRFKGYKPGERFTPDHQPPQKAAWFMGGCHEPAKFKTWCESTASVKKHCKACSNAQRDVMRAATPTEIRGWM